MTTKHRIHRFAWAAVALAAALWTTTATAPAWAQDGWDDEWEEEATLPFELHGFVEGAGASRTQTDPAQADHFLLGEARFRLDLSHFTDRAEMSFKGDFISDDITGENVIDIRQAWLSFRAATWLDLRAGSQVLTWGTGDLVFLNDLFPKDFVSFFIGRDDEFLKAPSTSVKLAAYWSLVNLDLVWTPVFEPDRYITGERISFYNPMAGGIVSAETMGGPFTAAEPSRKFDNGELAARLHRTAGGYEMALYGYWGYFKQPTAFRPSDGAMTFAPLLSVGASVRGNLLGGLWNAEGAYYDSREDRGGNDPNLPNSQWRALAGYEREVATNLTLGLQYYHEQLMKYDELLAASPEPGAEPNEKRQMATVRLTNRLMQQTLILSLFGFVAPDDGDTHWRASVTRQWTDAVAITVGANVMTGDPDTFFGQLEDATNAYARFRYSF